MPIPYDDVEYFDHRAAPAGHTARDMALVGRVEGLESGGVTSVDLSAIQDQLDAQEAVDVAQAAVDVANQAVNDAQQAQLDAINLTGKEDAGVAATLDAALQAQITANADLNTAQQAAITANIAAIAALQASIVKPDWYAAESDAAGILNKPDLDDTYQFISVDKEFTLAELSNHKNLTQHRFDISAGSRVVSYAEGLPIGYQIDHVVSVFKDGFSVEVSIGDGATEKIHNQLDVVDADGRLGTTIAGEYSLKKVSATKWRQFRSIPYSYAEAITLSVTATEDFSSAFVYRASGVPVGGAAPYIYTATITFGAGAHSGRTIVMTFDDPASGPVSVNDSAGTFTLGKTGAIVCDGTTTIGGELVVNGSTQSAFNGTFQNFELVNNLVDLNGATTITFQVTDGLAATTGVTL